MNKEFMNYMREMSEFWSNKYDKYKGEERHVVGRLDAPLEEYTLDTQNIKDCFLTISESGRAVIDFGCGIGRFRDVLSAKYPRYIGVDLVRKMGKDVEFYFLDTFLRRAFKVDAIFTSVVLQHVTNDKYLEFLFSRFNACLLTRWWLYLYE
jgi:SAM-dependent methyltransferase